MHFFVKVTAIVAVALVALIALAFVLKILILAAIVAALVIGGVAIARLFSRRPRSIVTYEPRRFGTRRWH